MGFLDFLKNLTIIFTWNWCKTKVLMMLQLSAKPKYPGKFGFSSYRPKCSHSLKSVILNSLGGINQYPSVFGCRQSPKKGAIWDYPFWFSVDRHNQPPPTFPRLASTTLDWSGAAGWIKNDSECRMVQWKCCMWFPLKIS